MLGGIDPILIFQFAHKRDPSFIGPERPPLLYGIPIISQIPTLIEEPPIPVYLSESITGLFVQSEDKNIDVETDVETLTTGATPDVNQKGLASSVSINLVAKKDSLGLILISALLDLVFEKVTSKEYSITYMHGPVTIFRGVVHTFSLNQTADNDLATVKIEISKGNKNPKAPTGVPTLPGITGPSSVLA